ncbi:MAG: winged helix DNA-binding domain-containing protein [Gemmatimonadota bacterium]|nr:winged helix DNA-binding domain-containing protein [Gemmatimonadota bacterium]
MPRLDICNQRLANQHLSKQTLEKPSEVVRLLGAVQAQDYGVAKWGVAQRTRNATDAAVEKELSEGAILRTHVLRPTWHFVVAADIRWMLALTAPRVKMILAHHDRTLEVDEAVIRRSRAAMTKALEGGKQLTRAELSKVLERARIRTESTQRLARLVMHAELDGVVCSGALREKGFTYALLEERVPRAKPLERDEALFELAKRYFNTRGPATVDDFAWWSGLTKADAKRGLQGAESGLEQQIIEGRRYWFPTPARLRTKSPVARLLPNFDEYFIGLKDRSAMLSTITTLGLEGEVGFLGGHLLTINGQVVGGWRRTFSGTKAIVEQKVLTTLGDVERRSIAREVQRFAAFLGTPVELAKLNVGIRF